MVGSGSSVVLYVSSGHWPTATVASCIVVGVLLDVGLASRKAKMFWTSERVNWWEEATGVGARKRLTAAIHAAQWGTSTRAGTSAVNGAAETFVCTNGNLVEPRGIKLGDNVRLPAHQCHGDGRWHSRATGARTGAGTGASSSREANSSSSQSSFSS